LQACLPSRFLNENALRKGGVYCNNCVFANVHAGFIRVRGAFKARLSVDLRCFGAFQVVFQPHERNRLRISIRPGREIQCKPAAGFFAASMAHGLKRSGRAADGVGWDWQRTAMEITLPARITNPRITNRGTRDLWGTEYTIPYQGRPAYTVSILEFRNGKVMHETQYFADPFEAPSWWSQWVQRMA
jgi:hypothetical protein